MALIKSQEIDFLSSDPDCLRPPSMFSRRVEKERSLESFLQTNPEISKLGGKVKDRIKKATEKVKNAPKILNNEQYTPPPRSLESQLSIIYKTSQECLVIVKDFVYESKTEIHTEEISTFTQTNNSLRQKIEFCNELLDLLQIAVFNAEWCYYEAMKISRDGKYYFVCE